jgi:hypothetical protein
MLTKKAIELLKKNQVAKNRLALVLSRSGATINRWLYESDTLILTTAAALEVIREETGLSDDEILEQQNKTA